jgi:hypothetical protein
MADDVAMLLNPLVALIDKQEFEEAPFEEAPFDEVVLEVNVSQRSREEEPSRRVVRTHSFVPHRIANCLLTHMP